MSCHTNKQHGTLNVKTDNRTTETNKWMSNTDPTKRLRVNSDPQEGKGFPASYRHWSCYSYTPSDNSIVSDRGKKTFT